MDQINTTTAAEDTFAPRPFPNVAFGVVAPEQVAGMSGIEALQAITAGAIPAPPIARVMRQWIERIAPGEVEFRGDPGPEYLNPMGIVHGGWTMTLLDSVLGCAVQSLLDASETYVSLGTEVKFNRPLLHTSGQVQAIGNVITRGKRTATAQARVLDARGRVIATGTTTCFIDRLGGKL
ncbi:MAG: PaaI family thioesterase [Burkholderiaceae bacterium]